MKKLSILLILIISVLAFPLVVNADTGPKPSIDIKIENLKTKNYIIDLFVYDEDGTGYTSPLDYNGGKLTDEQVKRLYDLNLDGWISESTRWSKYILFSDCSANEKYEHTFSYFGTPERYKIVIIDLDTDEMKVSDEIVRKVFNSEITIDYKTMEAVENNNSNFSMKTIVVFVLVLLLTLIIELLIGLAFKTGHYITIAIANLITNVCFQSLLLLSSNYLLAFIIGEIVVVVAELIVYLIRFKDISKVKTIIYTLVANLATILISLLLYRL